MRFKQLLVAVIATAGSITASLATAPYIEAIYVDASAYSDYRQSWWYEYNPSPTLTDPTPNPWIWTAQNIELQLDSSSTVTSVYWWAIEMWSWDPYYHCVRKNYYNRIGYGGYPVPDHYSPVNGKPQYIGTMGSGSGYMGTEIVGSVQHIYVSGLMFYSNTYYVYNGSELSWAALYEDGTVYIYNG